MVVIIFTPTTIPARVYGFRFIFFLDIILCCSYHRQLLLFLLIVFYILLFAIYRRPQTIGRPGLLIHRISVHRHLYFLLFPVYQLLLAHQIPTSLPGVAAHSKANPKPGVSGGRFRCGFLIPVIFRVVAILQHFTGLCVLSVFLSQFPGL